MADFNALEALINAHIKKNGVQAITGNILNGILRGMVSALGKGYTIAGSAFPATDPGTMTGPLAYIAYTAGTYTHFGGLEVEQGEVAMLIYNEAEWHKEVLFSLSATATIDGNVGTPEVGVSFVDGLLTFDFRNMKGNTGDAAGFGTISATVDGNIGTPGVTVQSSGPDTAKNIAFQFTNLKGETGVTSVVATVDNTVGTPTCTVSLVGQQLTLAFSGLKGAQGDTGSSVDYPFTIVNNLTTNDATQALSAAMGVQLEAEVSQLEAKVTDFAIGRSKLPITETGKYIPTNTGVGNVIGSVTSNATYYYIRHSVSPGDIVIVSATGGYAPRAWCFIDSSLKILSVCEAIVADGIVLVAPQNASEVIINSSTSDTRSCYYMSKDKLWESALDNNADILALRRKYDAIIGIETTKTDVPFSLQGYYAATTGTFTATTSAQCTPLTSLDGYNAVEYCGFLSASGAVLCFFDENQNFLQELVILGTGVLVSGRIVLSKEYTRAKYVAASVYGSSFFAYAFLRLCKSIPDSVSEQLARTKPIAESFDNIVKNTDFIENGFIGTNGAFTSSDSYRCTDFIKLDKAVKVHIFGLWSGGSSVVFCFYDKNKSKVGDTYNNIDSSSLEYVIPSIPSGAVFVRCSTRLSNLSSSSYVRIENETGAVIDEVLPLTVASKRTKLNVLIFGDSISDCTNITIANDKTTAYSWYEPSNRYTNSQGVQIGYYMWPYFVNKILNCYDCRCYAFQGASYRTMEREAGYERRNLQYQIQVALNDLTNPNSVFPTIGTYTPDIVFLALGVNDGYPSSSETYALTMAKTVYSDGVIDVDATLAALDFTNKADAIHGAFLQIKKYFPYALTFTVLPIQREADAFDQTNSISELIRQLAHRYSIHIIDGAREMGIVRDLCSDVDIYLKDGLHPNDKGQNLYTRLILSAIKKEWIDMSVLNPW